jgi:SAM-dependent methyltransferase
MKLATLLESKSGIKLDIGCGEHKFAPDWVGMDLVPYPGVDIIQDFNKHPWNLPDECVSTALCSHVLEHIPKVALRPDCSTWFPLVEFMDEIWRIMKPDGTIAFAVPHAHSDGYIQDPTHCSQINEALWYYFDPLSHDGYFYQYYRPKPWKIKTNEHGEPYVYFDPAGNMEVVLIKRRMDTSYEAVKK